jgi:putative transcription factor
MQCELCGIESAECKKALVEGVKLMVCPGCLRHGKVLHENVDGVIDVKKAILRRAERARRADVYEKMTTELVPDWSHRIREARVQKGLNREELGFRIGERIVTISKIENGDLRPSDEIVKKLEKELDISLMEEVKPVVTPCKSYTGHVLTLGDLLKTKKKE